MVQVNLDRPGTEGLGAHCADLREHIERLERQGLLRRVSKRVDNTWEIACITRWVFQSIDDNERYAILFEDAGEFGVPVLVGAIGGSNRIYAVSLGAPQGRFNEHWIHSMEHPIPPVVVPTGPVKERQLFGDEINLLGLPAISWTPEKDGGLYIAGHIAVTRDPDTGVQNAGTYRMMVRDRNSAVLNIQVIQGIGRHLMQYREKGSRMPVAVVIGSHPCIAAAATAKVPHGVDEFGVAGALNGAPVHLTRAETSDLLVPADAEYVIEGEVDPDDTDLEGPFGEYVGYMSLQWRKHVFHVTAITSRQQPIFQSYVSQMPPSESFVLQAHPFVAILHKQLVRDLAIPGIKDIAYTDGSAKLHLVISMRPQYAGHSKTVLFVAAQLLEDAQPKRVTVVDDDIDIRDPFLVEWATTFRCDPANDVYILNNMRRAQGDVGAIYDLPSEGDGIRPAKKSDIGARMLVDATMKKTFPAISLPPARLMYKVLEDWDQTGLPPIVVRERTRLLLERHSGSNLYIDPFKPTNDA